MSTDLAEKVRAREWPESTAIHASTFPFGVVIPIVGEPADSPGLRVHMFSMLNWIKDDLKAEHNWASFYYMREEMLCVWFTHRADALEFKLRWA